MTQNQQALGQIMFMHLMMGRPCVPAVTVNKLVPDITSSEISELWNMMPEKPPLPEKGESLWLSCSHPRNLMFWLFYNCGISSSLAFNSKIADVPVIGPELPKIMETMIDQMESIDKDAAQYIKALCEYQTLHPHSSNWIHYDEDEIFKMAKLKPDKKQAVYKTIREKFPNLVEFRVMGKNTPMPCYKLNILRSEVGDL